MLGNAQVNIKCISLTVKQLLVLFEVKIWEFTYERFSKGLYLQVEYIKTYPDFIIKMSNYW